MSAWGNGHKKALHFDHPPQRIVSLVPSITESLFDLGFGAAVVGRTDYCLHPAEALASVPSVGGPKTPRLDDILALHPDLVLANQEENPRPAVEALEAAGLRVLVTFPQTVRQALDVLWMLVWLFMDRQAAMRLETLELTVSWAEDALAERPPLRYFCPIWQGRSGQTDWWMTFNQETYAADVLRLMGGENVFAARTRRYPLAADLDQQPPEPVGQRDTRYPRVTLDEIRRAQPDIILLPSEPFAFTETHKADLAHWLADTPAGQRNRLVLLDGSLITWHGTRLARALQVLPTLLADA